MKRERPVCPRCGSNAVVADGPLEYDEAAEKWCVGSEIYDKSCFCLTCEFSGFSPDWKEHK